MKKLCAAFTALSCTAACMTGFHASAADNNLMKVLKEEGLYNGIIVETDGTELTEEMLTSFEGIESIQSWSSFKSWMNLGPIMTNVEDYAPDGTAYMVTTEKMDREALTALGRQLTVQLDTVTSVYLYDYAMYDYGGLTYNFLVNPLDGTDLDISAIPELEEFSVRANFGESEYAYFVYHQDVESTDLYAAMLEEAVTMEEKYAYYTSLCEQIQSAHSDVIASIVPEVFTLDSAAKSGGTVESIWQNAGDLDNDGVVDAKDAAEVLIIAAQNGAGASIAATSASDVNGDGSVDAQDAAVMLTYSAANGSGVPASWAEILK